jgi:hypothetical protein
MSSRIGWHQRAIRQPGPIAADGAIERSPALRADVVVNAIDPLSVWSESGLSAEIESQVDPKPARFCYRIDEMVKGSSAA